MGYVLGVDFGTSFTAAVAYSAGSSRVVTLGKRAGAVPTATYVREDGTLIHGEDAFLVGAHDPERLVRNLKRRLADSAPIVVAGRSFTAVELCAAYLRWVVDAAATSEGAPADALLFTHPANWRSVRLDQFREALRLAGLTNVHFAAEPFAAAAFHAITGQVSPGDLVAVYDLGGGTFDAAVLRRVADGFELAGDPEGIEHLGGVDFDDVLFHLLRSRVGDPWITAERKGGPSYAVAVAGIRRESTAAKEALSVDTEVEVPVMLPGVNQVVKVTRTEFERLIAPSVQDTIGAFRRALREAGVAPADLSAVLLVGGSVALGVVRDAVRQLVGDVTPVLDADPKYAVARGAALLAGRAGATAGPAAAGSPAAAPTGPPGAAAGPVAPPAVAVPGTPPSPATPLAAAPPPAGSPLPGSPPPTVGPPPTVMAAPVAPSPGPAPTPGPGAVPPPVAQPPVAPPPAGPPGPAPTPGGPPPGTAGTAARQPATFEPPPKKSKVPLLIGGLVVLAVVAAGGVFLASRGDGDGAQAATGTTADGTTGTTEEGGGGGGGDGPSDIAAGPASADRMSPVDAGTFAVGLDPPGAESAALREVELAAFHLDTFEVTNQQYDAFVQRIGAPPATSWPGGRVPDDELDHPVKGVEFDWASAYCRSLSKRLPTEAEWEAAARGPDALTYPWGEDRTAVDIDTAGTRPVGSTEGNISPFGIHDTVASVWEWVDEPYEPVADGQRVRHGGENGRVRDGAAMRQVVDPANASVVAETGFRCAADEVSDSVQPGQFSRDITLPERSVTATSVVGTGRGPGTVLVDDNFEQRTSGFREEAGETYAFGYYAPSWYHLEATGSGVQTVSVGGYSYSNASIETHVHVDGAETGNGRVRYGLVVRAVGEVREPPVLQGPPRPTDFIAFTIDPRAGRWELLVESEAQPLRAVQSGALPPTVKAFDREQPDGLRVEMRDTMLTLFVNDVQVATYDTGVVESNGDVGFFVENIDETFADVHFADLRIVEL